ncbi:hypothetical protein BpHYR1_004463 [Brachionus plicatilis]|uniref:Uncharacterized protein n=1 Tax=Brachionus plicatilis TaxID=10195 RepID=A0A3M7S9Z7_BRAPC|nr:hypothetical protein BpHYR1_004463 [Brachionus plicatilis]
MVQNWCKNKLNRKAKPEKKNELEYTRQIKRMLEIFFISSQSKKPTVKKINLHTYTIHDRSIWRSSTADSRSRATIEKQLDVSFLWKKDVENSINIKQFTKNLEHRMLKMEQSKITNRNEKIADNRPKKCCYDSFYTTNKLLHPNKSLDSLATGMAILFYFRNDEIRKDKNDKIDKKYEKKSHKSLHIETISVDTCGVNQYDFN